GVGIGDGGEDPLSPPADALDAQLPHQPGHLVPADLMAGASGGLPELVGPVDLAVRDPQREQDLGHHRVADGPSRRLDLAALGGVVGARSDLQDSADRLDSELVTMAVDVIDDHFDGRSSSAAKKAEADLRIAFARRSSRTSCSSAFTLSASAELTPGFAPSSMSACLTQPRTDSTPYPS